MPSAQRPYAAAPPRCPPTTALSIVPGSPVSIQSPARKSPSTGVAAPGAAAGPAPARTSPASRGSRWRAGAWRRAPGSASATSRGGERDERRRCRVPPARRRRSPRATGATPSRRTRRRLSNTHCISRPGSPTNGSSITGRSYQRFTVTIGFESMRDAARDDRRQRRRCRRAEQRSQREPRHRGDDARPSNRSPRTSTPRDAAVSITTRASAFDAHLSAARSMKRARRLGVHLVRAAASAARATTSVAIRPEHLGQHADEGRRRGDIRRLVQRRDRQRLPQPLAKPSALAVRVSHSRDGAGWLGARPFRCGGAPSARDGAGPPGASRRADRARAARPSRGRRRAGAAATAAAGSAAPSVAVACRDTALPATAASRTLSLGADPPQESERLAIAAEQHVLAVVDELAGLAIDEGRRAAAELGRASSTITRRPRSASRAPRAQPGEAAADHDDVEPRRSYGSDAVASCHWCASVPPVRASQADGRAGPGGRGDQRALRTGNADDPAEDVVVRSLDAGRGCRGRSRP